MRVEFTRGSSTPLCRAAVSAPGANARDPEVSDPEATVREAGHVDALSATQRTALRELVRPYRNGPRSRWTRRARGFDVAWGVLLASLFALAIASLETGSAFLRAADRLYLASHSSVASRRTM